MGVKLSCFCGHYGEIQVDMENPESVRFNSVAIICRKCGLATHWHKGFSLQGSSLAAMDDWELIQEKKVEAKNAVHGP